MSAPSDPALAYGAGVYLMAWVDNRLDVDSQVGDVFAARFSESGSPLDRTPMAVGTALQDEAHPSVAFDGTNFLVTWFRYRIPPYNGGGDTVGARVTLEGRVIEENPIVILRDGYGTAAVSGSPGWIVAGADTNDSSMLRLADVDPDGTVRSARTLSGPPDAYGEMATGGGTLLMVGRSNAALIDLQTNSLKPLNPQLDPITISGVAWGGDAYYVTSPSSTGTSISLARVTTTGDMTPVSVPATGGYSSAVAARDGNLFVAYASSSAELRARIVHSPRCNPARSSWSRPNKTGRPRKSGQPWQAVRAVSRWGGWETRVRTTPTPRRNSR